MRTVRGTRPASRMRTSAPDRTAGRFYRPRLCLALDAEPQTLGFEVTPRLARDIRELRMRLMKRREFMVHTALVAGGFAVRAPRLDPAKLAGVLSIDAGRDPHVYGDLLRIAASFAVQLDMVSPSSLMQQVLGLLQQERELLKERRAPPWSQEQRLQRRTPREEGHRSTRPRRCRSWSRPSRWPRPAQAWHFG